MTVIHETRFALNSCHSFPTQDNSVQMSLISHAMSYILPDSRFCPTLSRDLISGVCFFRKLFDRTKGKKKNIHSKSVTSEGERGL